MYGKLPDVDLENRALEEAPMADLPPYPGTPRWVKIVGIIALVLVLVVSIALVTGVGGGHGPLRHTPSGGAGGHTLSVAHGLQQV